MNIAKKAFIEKRTLYPEKLDIKPAEEALEFINMPKLAVEIFCKKIYPEMGI